MNEELRKFDSHVLRWNTEQNYLLREILAVRRETIIHKIEAYIYILRMFMLTSSLRVPGYKLLHPIFVSGCGLNQAIA